MDAFAELLLSAPTFIANFIRSEAAAAAAAGRHAAEIGTMTDASVVDMGTQATADDAVDTATAEAMIAEALRMVDEANERERLAEERARSWQGYSARRGDRNRGVGIQQPISVSAREIGRASSRFL